MKAGRAHGRDVTEMKAPDEIVEDDLLRLFLSKVMLDRTKYGVDSKGKGRGGCFGNFNGAVDGLV